MSAFFALLGFLVKGKFYDGDAQGADKKSRKIAEALLNILALCKENVG